MKLLCTGCLGFIGSHFAEIATEAGHDVFGYDARTYAARVKNLPTALEFMCEDICNYEAVRWAFNYFKPDAIVHFAAESHVARSIDSREEFLRTNVIGTNVLLEESLRYWRGDMSMKVPADDTNKRKFMFLHVSTDEVYGSIKKGSWTERSPYAPNNPYSASKAASDALVRAYNMTYGLPTIITHASNNYGTKQHPEKLIPTLISQCMRGQNMTLHGDGSNVRDWLHVKDHCYGLLQALKLGKAGETYNFGGMCERTNLEIAKLIATSMGKTKEWIEFVPDRAGNDLRYSTDITKVNRALKWLPQAQIENRIKEVIRWYIGNQNYGDEYGK